MFEDLAEVLAGLVDRPENVNLVIAVDFAEAVMRRNSSVPYTTTRGSGLVGGRTMTRSDGGDDVLIDGNWLIDVDTNGNVIPRPFGVALMERSITHEAQHVVMHQRGSGFEAYGRSTIPGWIGLHLFDAASVVLDEHRAEWGAVALTEHEYPTTGSVADVLSALGTQIAAVDTSYQHSHDVRSLMEGTLTACQPFWVAMAYWAAQYRGPTSMQLPPPEILEMPLWKRYVGGSWPEVSSAFCEVPVDDLSTSPQLLHEAAKVMAAALRSSLGVIGFQFTEDDEGSAFYVDRHDFPP